MTNIPNLYYLRQSIEYETDDEWDDDINFIVSLNSIISEVNMSCNCDYNLVALDNETISAAMAIDSTQPWNELLGMQPYAYFMVYNGLGYKLLTIEQEDDRFVWETKFNKAIQNFMIRLPQDDRAKQTTYVSMEIGWDEDEDNSSVYNPDWILQP